MSTINDLQYAITQLSRVEGCRFASVTYRARESGELARHNLLLGVDIERAYKRDLTLLSRRLSRLQGISRIACEELVASLRESLRVGIGNNSGYTQRDIYEPVLPGIKLHRETGELYLTGLSRSKVVLEPGTHKAVKSSEKTIAKNELRKCQKIGKIRTFRLNPENLKAIRTNGRTIEIE